jgi:arsenate reductase-like glutaredoxin family protein
MDKWIEIFRAGNHTDSNGRTRTWTRDDLDKTVASYNPEHNEAPVVIGHPQNNGPAYGWVEGLKRVGDLLVAKLKQVEPQFAEMVKAGRYKKRSASFYADGSLRHIGFLGAVPPAIKGLKDFIFNEDAPFEEYQQPITKENEAMTQEEFEEMLKEERQKTAAALQQAADFKEKLGTAAANFAEAQKSAKQKEIAAFINDGITTGKLLPAWKDQGLGEFMAALEENQGEYEFSEGKKQSPADFFREFLESFSAHPLFKEMVKPADEKNRQDAEFEEADRLGDEIAAYVGGGSE